MVVAAQARRYRTGVWKLVIRTFAKAHRTGHDRSVEFGRHECYHGTRVHAPAQKGPQRHIAAEPDADRLARALAQLFPAVLLEARALSVNTRVPTHPERHVFRRAQHNMT